MKKTLLIICMICFAFNPLVAGNIDISLELSQTPYKWGGKNGNSFEYIIGETSDEYLALRATIFFLSYDYKIARYEKSTMNLIEVKPFFPKDYIKKGTFKPTYSWGVNQYKDQIYFLFGYTDQWNNNTAIYGQKLNNDGSFDGDANKLMEAPFVKGSVGWFGGTYSYDSSKFLQVYEIPTKNKENQHYMFHVYSIPDFGLVSEKDIELPFLDKDVNLKRYDVDNDGNVYALVQLYEKGTKNQLEADMYTFKIYGFRKDSDDPVEYDFSIDNYYINSLTFQVKAGILYVSGFWGKKNASDISGVYSLRLDASTGQELAEDVYEFSDEFIAEFYSDKEVDRAEKKGKELEVKTIVLDHFKVQDDGSAFVIGEQFYTYSVYVSTGNGGYWKTYYVYNDIVVTKIDNNGVILWSSKIPKKSVNSNSAGHLSYHVHQKGNDLYFIYYDHKNNFELTDPKKYDRVPFYGQNLDLVCTKINGDGEKEKTLIYNYNDASWNQLRLTPINFQNINSSEVLGQGFVKGKKEVLSRFTIR